MWFIKIFNKLNTIKLFDRIHKTFKNKQSPLNHVQNWYLY